jgi:hypothetical protein
MAQVKLTFDSKEDAQAYAKKNGWKFETRGAVAQANENIEVGTMMYSHNFLRRRVILEMAEAKRAGKKVAEFAQKGALKSNWFMPHNYDGTADVVQFGDAKPPNKR